MSNNNRKPHAADGVFCILPFMHLVIFPDGQCSYCCLVSENIHKDGEKLSVSTEDIAGIFHSDYMNSVREKMLSGIPVKACELCYQAERAGATSQRLESNKEWLSEFGLTPEPWNREKLVKIGLPSSKPLYYQIMPGNVCNLSCRMCNPYYSSRIAADKKLTYWMDTLGAPFPSLDWSREWIPLTPMPYSDVATNGLDGFEINDGGPFRWTDGHARIRVKVPPDAEIRGARIEIAPSPRAENYNLAVRINCSEIFKGTLDASHQLLEFDTVNFPGGTDAEIELISDTFVALNDPRKLGVPLREIALRRSGPSSRLNKISNKWFADFEWSKKHILSGDCGPKKLYFTGGEPMLSEYFCKTLDYLVQTGSAAEIGLTLNTNGTVLNEQVLANFRHFKHVVVSVSIDGFGKLNSYIRHHSNWVQIEKNVTKLKQMESDCIRIGVGPTVQAYNSLYLADLFEWMEKNKLPLFTHDILTQPQILGVGILPSHVKEFAAQKLRKYALDCRPAFAEMVVQISNRIADSADDCTEENLLLFLRFTADLDTLRNQDFKEVCPELHDMIRSYVQQTM